jgi:hypothetical protein
VITFTYNPHADRGVVHGQGWHHEFQGCGGLLPTWMAANAAGFLIAPGAVFNPAGATPVVLGREARGVWPA